MADTEDPPADDDPMADLLTAEQAMAVLRCGKTTVYRMIGEGKLPTIWHRGRHWIPRSAITEYFEAQRVEGAQRANKLAGARGRKRPRSGTARGKRTSRRRGQADDETSEASEPSEPSAAGSHVA